MTERLTRVPRVQEVWSLNLGLAKSYTALQTVRHRFNICSSSCVALALQRGDGHRKLVTRLGVTQRIQRKVWFSFAFFEK